MGLRADAAADLKTFLEDTAGFGWPITITDPGGTSKALTGSSADIHQTIDPETGQLISGHTASVTLSMASLRAVGLGIPANVSATAGKPWLVVFDDIAGVEHTFKVKEAMPDRTLDCVACILEIYTATG